MKTQDILKIREYKTKLLINEVFKKRFSPTVFSTEKINENDLKTIFEAVRFTPSSYNRQPWFFYVVKNGSEKFNQFVQLLSLGNEWAANAPVLILSCNINKDNYGYNDYAQYDLGQAVATLVYQSQILGYYTHQMAGFDKEKAKQYVDKNHIPWVMIALGKIGNYQKAPKLLIKKDSQRKPRKEKVYEVI